MITTVTLNAAMDRALVVPNFLAGRRHRASSGVTLPGGKGVTIARALKTLGSPVIATGLAGGLNGANIVERLTSEGILNDFVRIAEPSRTSTAVIDPVTGVHTEINEYGPRVARDELDLFSEKLRYLARASRCVVIAGSLPRDVEPDTYQRFLRYLHGNAQDVRTVLTAPDDSAVLRASLGAEPSLTIIDQREAESLVGHEFGSDDDFLIALDEMARIGGQSIIVTHDTGCVARLKQGRTVSYIAASHDPVEPVSELGSTDVFVAAFVHAMFADRPLADRLTFGLAAALANMRQLGAGVFEMADVARLHKDITARELEPVEAEIDAD
jgi:1-phosphofructokinase/tagatose 6-phosphate kinase